MKILMQGRIDLINGGGGDKIQIENTAKELKKLGVEVAIKHGYLGDLSDYDLVHAFQLDWVSESYFYAKNAEKCKKPLVLSPIHHSIKEVKKFDDEYVFDFRRISKILFSDQFHRDTFKNVYRSLLSPKKMKATFVSATMGLKKMHQETLKISNAVLVQTKLEAEDLKNTYGIDFEWFKVPNGVSDNFLNLDNCKNELGFDNYIISVGRIEPRKNQLNIIKAVERLREKTGQDIKLVFIGKKSLVKHLEYSFLFNNILKKEYWIKYIEAVPYQKMPSYYHFAKVCVSASWFESTGLTLLEALFCGTNAVASGDRAGEYLENLASYCKPDDVDTILNAIEKEFYAPRPILPERMKKDYTWENAAKKTLNIYQKVLGIK